MIAVTQTKRGGPDVPPEERGDCFDACLASLLEVDIREVHVPHVDAWWDRAQEVVERHGYRIVYLDYGDEGATASSLGEWLGPLYWLAAVPSLNLGADDDGRPVRHVIVMRGCEVAHDPSLGARYPHGPLADDVAVTDVMLLVPLEPRAVAA